MLIPGLHSEVDVCGSLAPRDCPVDRRLAGRVRPPCTQARGSSGASLPALRLGTSLVPRDGVATLQAV